MRIINMKKIWNNYLDIEKFKNIKNPFFLNISLNKYTYTF